MFVGLVDLGNGTELELVIVPLKDSALPGQWKSNTDLVMLCVVQTGRCCTCRPADKPDRFVDKLDLPKDDAEHLTKWLQTHLA